MRLLAKKSFSLIFLVLFLSALGWICPTGAQQDISSTIGNVGNVSGLPYGSVYEILLNFLLWLLRLFTILAIISFILAGILFLLSGSNKELADKAKSAVGYSIIGIVVALSAYILIILISELLWGGSMTDGSFFFI